MAGEITMCHEGVEEFLNNLGRMHRFAQYVTVPLSEVEEPSEEKVAEFRQEYTDSCNNLGVPLTQENENAFVIKRIAEWKTAEQNRLTREMRETYRRALGALITKVEDQMPETEFEVSMQKIMVTSLCVSAKNREEAEEKALESADDADWDDNGDGIEVTSIDEQ